jgi:hypothetical protein
MDILRRPLKALALGALARLPVQDVVVGDPAAQGDAKQNPAAAP